jgi:hypothetical protein
LSRHANSDKSWTSNDKPIEPIVTGYTDFDLAPMHSIARKSAEKSVERGRIFLGCVKGKPVGVFRLFDVFWKGRRTVSFSFL